MKNRKLMKVLLIVLPILAAVLLALPRSVCMRFADMNGPIYTYFSAFSMIPPGYGNWGPMLAVLSAILVAVMAVIYWFREGKKLGTWIFGWSLFGAGVLGVTALIFGSGTVLSWIAAAALAAASWIGYQVKE